MGMLLYSCDGPSPMISVITPFLPGIGSRDIWSNCISCLHESSLVVVVSGQSCKVVNTPLSWLGKVVCMQVDKSLV